MNAKDSTRKSRHPEAQPSSVTDRRIWKLAALKVRRRRLQEQIGQLQAELKRRA